MKVIKNNYYNDVYVDTNPYPRKLICENCKSELEYEKLDMRMGEYGCMFIDCPLCGYDNMLENNEYNITLTMDNIEFPTHFHHISKDTGAVDICTTDEVKEAVRRAINYFRRNKKEYAWTTWRGNMYVCVLKYDGDESYEITVSNDFYKTEIPFEEEDYEEVE